MKSPAITANSPDRFQPEQQAKTESNAFGKAWRWIKEHHEAIIITTISVVAAAALVAGLTFLTIAFPYVMVPIYIFTGVGAALTVALFAGFAAGGH